MSLSSLLNNRWIVKTLIAVAGVVALAFIGVFKVASQETSAAAGDVILEADAYVVEHEGTKLLAVNAILINQGDEEIKVLTAAGASSSRIDDRMILISFSFTMRERNDERLLIPSIVTHEPVTLRPGEATKLVMRTDGSVVQDLRAGDTIRVNYIVWETWAERFDLFEGPIETTAVVREIDASRWAVSDETEE